MEYFFPLILFIAGVIALVWGGDRFVGSSSWIAEQTGVPKFVIGATVVSIATTLPELIVSLMATWRGMVDMAVGNAVGSVSANIGLIMGLSLLLLPEKVEDSAFWSKGLLMVTATAFLGAFLIDGRLRLWESVVLLLMLVAFFYLNLHSIRVAGCLIPGSNRAKRQRPRLREIAYHLFGFVLGLAGILLGAQLLVENGARLARMFGASEALIGLTFVAIGTSLPELITTLSAIAKREASLSIGNIIGANIIDITMILAGCSFVSRGTLVVSAQTSSLDVPIALLLMVVTVFPAIAKKRFYRWQGVLLLMIYGLYVGWMAVSI